MADASFCEYDAAQLSFSLGRPFDRPLKATSIADERRTLPRTASPFADYADADASVRTSSAENDRRPWRLVDVAIISIERFADDETDGAVRTVAEDYLGRQVA